MNYSNYLIDGVKSKLQQSIKESGKKITLDEYEQLIRTVVECISLNMDDIVDDAMEGILMERVEQQKNDKGGNKND